MAHKITFESFWKVSSLISEDEVRDLIDIFYRFPDASFVVVGHDERSKYMGLHTYDGCRHTIDLFRSAIEQAYKDKSRCGGNSPAPSLKMAVVMVFTHELQHANQSRLHRHDEKFYRTRVYNKRPCERDARAFVDNNMRVLSDFVGFELKEMKFPSTKIDVNSELAEIIDNFKGLESVSLSDIKDELRLSSMLNPLNVSRITSSLISLGTSVISGSNLTEQS